MAPSKRGSEASQSTLSSPTPDPHTLPQVDVTQDDTIRRPLLPNELPSHDTEDGATEQPAARPLHLSRSYSHLPRQTPAALFPPFYNRPPTPLPPSPSLKSLLRPSFNTTASHLSMLEISDIDKPQENTEPVLGADRSSSSTAKLAISARHAPNVPRAAPKVPTYEYYGFAVYLGSSAAFLAYILWAYTPAPMLHQLGIHWYPNRWWALAIPCWLIVLIVYIYIALASYNTKYLTLPLNSLENLVDETAQIAVVDIQTRNIVRSSALVVGKPYQKIDGKKSIENEIDHAQYQFLPEEKVDWKDLWSTGTDAVLDVPIGGVCEILYGD